VLVRLVQIMHEARVVGSSRSISGATANAKVHYHNRTNLRFYAARTGT